MADRYLLWTNTAVGRALARRLGLPRPVPLRRRSPGEPESVDGPLLHLAPEPSALEEKELAAVLAEGGRTVRTGAESGTAVAVAGSAAEADPSARPGTVGAVVLDATGVRTVPQLHGVHNCLHPVLRSLGTHARVVVLGGSPDPADHHRAAAQQALEGLVRSLGKELGGARTAQLVRFAGGASAADGASTLRFLLSPGSAYVSGQVIDITAPARESAEEPAPVPGAAAGTPSAAAGAGTEAAAGRPERPLAGRTALVTGCARGIGAAVAATLARDGAHVVCLDVPSAAEDLARVAEQLDGTALPLDITAADAGVRIQQALPEGELDVLVHNAGITRDRRLVNMSADRWDAVLDVNLGSVLRVTDQLLAARALRRGTGRVVATASIAGIAGNAGQTNYAASKAGVIGFVRALAPRAAAEHGVTVNAVAPGFIETRMTAAMPLFLRQAGRRMNSLSQGGSPADVAETVAWLADPASSGVNGQVVRVCGQSLLGA